MQLVQAGVRRDTVTLSLLLLADVRAGPCVLRGSQGLIYSLWSAGETSLLHLKDSGKKRTQVSGKSGHVFKCLHIGWWQITFFFTILNWKSLMVKQKIFQETKGIILKEFRVYCKHSFIHTIFHMSNSAIIRNLFLISFENLTDNMNNFLST